jgi:outer membrane lipoprotein-sorting protein
VCALARLRSLTRVMLLTPVFLRADSLDGALQHLDRAGTSFVAMSAHFTNLQHTAIAPDNDFTSNGEMRIKRPRSGQLLGWIDFVAPDPKTVALNGRTVSILLPKMNTVEVYDLGKHQALLEQFFLLGFGTSRHDLEAAYTTSYGGAEVVHGEPTTRVVLISRKPEVRKQLSQLELWISDKSGEPVRQRFNEPNGNFNVFTYLGMKTTSLPDSAFKLKLPKGVKTVMMKK